MNQTNFIQASIHHDCRRIKANNKYPVKLKIYIKQKRKIKLFNTGIDLNTMEFKIVWLEANHGSLRGKNRKLNQTFIDLLARADEIIEQMEVFDFNEFEKILMAGVTESVSIQELYEEKIKQLADRNSFSTIDTYIYSLKALEGFSLLTNKKPLAFEYITIKWLEKFETYMIDNGKSISTVGVYLRPLKAIFNIAIDKGALDQGRYPFGKNKYSIPTSSKVKKALSNEDIKTLINSEALTPLQQRAKDFWFLSFMCNGINLVDIAHLKHKNIDLHSHTLNFIRIKTQNNRPIKKPISVKLNQWAIETIKKYTVYDNGEYVFNIINSEDSPKISRLKIRNLNHSINKQIKKLAKNNGILREITFYWARHSFSTVAIRSGGRQLEFVQEALGHSNIKTTQNYFAGFANKEKEDFANFLMDFTK